MALLIIGKVPLCSLLSRSLAMLLWGLHIQPHSIRLPWASAAKVAPLEPEFPAPRNIHLLTSGSGHHTRKECEQPRDCIKDWCSRRGTSPDPSPGSAISLGSGPGLLSTTLPPASSREPLSQPLSNTHWWSCRRTRCPALWL